MVVNGLFLYWNNLCNLVTLGLVEEMDRGVGCRTKCHKFGKDFLPYFIGDIFLYPICNTTGISHYQSLE